VNRSARWRFFADAEVFAEFPKERRPISAGIDQAVIRFGAALFRVDAH